jgi:hypothetical protein
MRNRISPSDPRSPTTTTQVFGAEVEKLELVPLASKWTRHDDTNDGDEKDDAKGKGLGYSSPGRNELLGSIMKRHKANNSFANSSGLTNDTSMDEDRK